jgi:S-methylmethionine-dependent homocysteine/selenocysteine methylase
VARYESFMERITSGECVLTDGATGTEAERRGIPQLENAWNGGGALSHPDIIRQIHLDYLDAGAEVVISNSFATHLHALADAGEADRFGDYNRRAVELAVEARDGSDAPGALVGAGMSYWSWTDNPPPAAEMRRAATRQADVMAAAGADVIMLEMMVDLPNLEIMLDAVSGVGLPVWAGLTCRPGDGGVIALRRGGSLFDTVRLLDAHGVDVVNIMHTDVEYISASVADISELWQGPIGVYAHSSTEVDKQWVFDDVISPAAYCDLAARWKDQGVSLIGGCCGITTAHVIEMKRRLFA